MASQAQSPEYLLEMRGISKAFPGVRALEGVDLQLKAGEVLALVGENGAGKSTLIKVLSGAHPPDSGSIFIEGWEIGISGPLDAQRCGVAVIYQEFNLVPSLSARENIFLGRETAVAGFVSSRIEREKALGLFRRLGVSMDPDVPCRRLTVAHQQIVEIAKALSLEARIIVMDEPSATLTTPEVHRLFQVIRELKALGIGIIYISHRLDEIFEIADQVLVLRDGRRMGSRPVASVSRYELIEMMVGRRIENEFPKRECAIGDPRLKLKGLTRRPQVHDVSFEIRGGEVLGLTGPVGSGRTETARLIFGADRPDSGSMELDGRSLRIRHPRDAIDRGIVLLTEDRKAHGLVLNHAVRENFGLPNLRKFALFGFMRQRLEKESLARHVKRLDIRLQSLEQPARTLSGGNQQKVVLAKWLEANADVIIFDEPTRGIDVGAKYEIYQLINQLAAQGKAILMISSELPEVLGMSDRILVMRRGRVAGEIYPAKEATQEQIMSLAVG